MLPPERRLGRVMELIDEGKYRDRRPRIVRLERFEEVLGGARVLHRRDDRGRDHELRKLPLAERCAARALTCRPPSCESAGMLNVQDEIRAKIDTFAAELITLVRQAALEAVRESFGEAIAPATKPVPVPALTRAAKPTARPTPKRTPARRTKAAPPAPAATCP
jgi:hypothetical protein